MNSAVATSFLDFISRWELLSAWTFVVLLLVIIYAFGSWRLYRKGGGLGAISLRRIGSAATAFIAIFIALVGPFEAFSGELLLAHMIQHMLLIFAAPLLLIANPMSSYLWGLPSFLRDGATSLFERNSPIRKVLVILTKPKIALPLFVINLWAWHYPPLYDLAVTNSFVHLLEHFLMFVTSILFWWPIVGPAPVRSPLSYPKRMIYMLAVVTPSAALAAFITLNADVLYSSYLNAPLHFEITPREDQTYAGLILWLPGNFAYIAAIITLFFKWAKTER